MRLNWENILGICQILELTLTGSKKRVVYVVFVGRAREERKFRTRIFVSKKGTSTIVMAFSTKLGRKVTGAHLL